jgi:hypothetical protein
MWWQDPTQVPGSNQYEKWDIGWFKAIEAYRTSIKAPWPQGGTIVDIPETCTICVAGDWGTSIPPATTSFAVLRFDDSSMTEQIIDEFGRSRWTARG